MNALDNGMQASTVGLIYTSKCLAPCTSFRENNFAIWFQYFAESVETRKKKIKIKFK